MQVAVANSKFGIRSLEGDDSLIRYYTGFPSECLEHFMHFLGHLLISLPTGEQMNRSQTLSNGPATDDPNASLSKS